jgi:hypothetical protein
MVEPAQLHTCTMHGGLAIEVSGARASGMADAHHMATHLRAHNHQHNTNSKSRQCSCLGDCSGGSSVVGLPSMGVSFVAAVAGIDSAGQFAYASPFVATPHFLLQFANGPPSFLARA